MTVTANGIDGADWHNISQAVDALLAKQRPEGGQCECGIDVTDFDFACEFCGLAAAIGSIRKRQAAKARGEGWAGGRQW